MQPAKQVVEIAEADRACNHAEKLSALTGDAAAEHDGIGAMVMSVDRAGPSASAGIRQGDVIVSWNNQKLSGVRALLRALGPDSVGSVVDVAVQRPGEPKTFKLTIGERPEA